MFEFNKKNLKKVYDANDVFFKSEALAIFMLAIHQLFLFLQIKFLGNLGHAALDGKFSQNVEEQAFKSSYFLGTSLYMSMFTTATANSIFLTSKEKAALATYSAEVRNSQASNHSIRFRRMLWSYNITYNKLCVNSWAILAMNPCLGMVNGAVATFLGAKLNGMDNQTSIDIVKLGAATGCMVGTISVILNLSVRYICKDKSKLLIDYNDNVADKDENEKTLLDLLSERLNDPDPSDHLFAMLWENAREHNSPLAAMVEEHNVNINREKSREALRKFQ